MRNNIYVVGMLLFFLLSINAKEIRIDYIGLINSNTNCDINGFYNLWSLGVVGGDSYSCYIEEEELIENFKLCLAEKVKSEDKFAWPMCILYLTDNDTTTIYEIGLKRLKQVGDETIYKIPWELWMLIKEQIPMDSMSLFDYYTKVFLSRNIYYNGFHYTD